jgi:hypothetical protein
MRRSWEALQYPYQCYALTKRSTLNISFCSNQDKKQREMSVYIQYVGMLGIISKLIDATKNEIFSSGGGGWPYKPQNFIFSVLSGIKLKLEKRLKKCWHNCLKHVKPVINPTSFHSFKPVITLTSSHSH